MEDADIAEVTSNGRQMCIRDREEHMVTNIVSSGNGMQAGENGDDRDTQFIEAGKRIIEKEKASIGMLQRMLKIGFNRAARIMDQDVYKRQ